MNSSRIILSDLVPHMCTPICSLVHSVIFENWGQYINISWCFWKSPSDLHVFNCIFCLSIKECPFLLFASAYYLNCSIVMCQGIHTSWHSQIFPFLDSYIQFRIRSFYLNLLMIFYIYLWSLSLVLRSVLCHSYWHLAYPLVPSKHPTHVCWSYGSSQWGRVIILKY